MGLCLEAGRLLVLCRIVSKPRARSAPALHQHAPLVVTKKKASIKFRSSGVDDADSVSVMKEARARGGHHLAGDVAKKQPHAPERSGSSTAITVIGAFSGSVLSSAFIPRGN